MYLNVGGIYGPFSNRLRRLYRGRSRSRSRSRSSLFLDWSVLLLALLFLLALGSKLLGSGSFVNHFLANFPQTSSRARITSIVSRLLLIAIRKVSTANALQFRRRSNIDSGGGTLWHPM